MPELPEETESEGERTTRTITDGYFEKEYHVGAESAGEFLIELGEQLRDGDEVTVSDDGWELPFAFGEPVELEVEFSGDGEPELEIEVELSGRIEDESPDVA